MTRARARHASLRIILFATLFGAFPACGRAVDAAGPKAGGDPGPAVFAVIVAGFASLSAAGAFFYLRLHRLHASLRKREAELVELSARLKVQAEHLRLIIDTVPAYIYAKDDSGHFILANKLFAQVFGCPPGEVAGKTNADYGATPEETARFLDEDREIIRTGRPLFIPEERAPRPDRSMGWFRTTKIPYKHPDWEKSAVLGVSIDITEQREQAELIRRMAQHDSLTGLANRALFSELFGKALALTKRTQGRLALLFIDLDDFKPVNDNHGHIVGDRVLETTARRIEGSLRESDGAGRMGGDEFVAFLLGLSDPKDADAIARKLRNAIRRPIELEEGILTVDASIGVAVFPGDGQDEEELLRHADEAMYRMKQKRQAKRSGTAGA